MSIIKKLASQTALYGLTNVSRLINFLILAKLHSTVLSQSESGIQGNIYAYISFLNILFTYGLETAFFRFSTKSKDPNTVFGTAYISLIITSIFLIILGNLFWPYLKSFTGFENHSQYLFYILGILLLDTLSAIPFASLRLQNKPIRFAIIKIIGMGVFLIMNIFFLWLCPEIIKGNIFVSLQPFINSFYINNYSIEYILISNLFSSLISYILLSPLIFNFKFGFNFKLWKEMVVFSFPLLIAGILGMTNETLDRVLIPELIDGTQGLIENGIYSQCYKISIFLTVFVQAFKYAVEPFFFSKSLEENAKDTYAMIMKWFILICIIVITGILLYIDIFKHLLHEKFWEGLTVVPILLLANMFMGIHSNLSIWYKITDKTKFGLIISLIGAILTILLNIIWIPIFGYIGAAWATLISYAGMTIINYFIGQKYYAVNYKVASFFVLLLSMIFIVTLSDAITAYYRLNFGHKIILNTILYLIYLSVLYKFYITKIYRESQSLK